MTFSDKPAMTTARPRQAAVLVGGRGSRLGSLTRETPKPLMPIEGDRVFLDYLLNNVARHGVEEILLLAGHLGEQVEARYDGKKILGAEIRVVCERQPAGTAGALLAAGEQLDEAFFLLNGDAFLDFNLLSLSEGPLPVGGARLALRHVEDTSRYGRVQQSNGLIDSFEEKSTYQTPGLINGGVYWMRREVLDRIEVLPSSLEQDIFPAMAKDQLLFGVLAEGYFIDIGLPDTLAQARRELPAVERRPTAFLDRDGTLNVDHGYTYDPDTLQWIDGAVSAIRQLNDAGWYVIVCTNQAGVARGLYDEAAVGRFHASMLEQLRSKGAHIDAFYHCPYHADASESRYKHADHPDRKPNPGMLLRATRDWPVRVEASIMIGDRDADVQAGAAAGLRSVLFDKSNLAQFMSGIGLPVRSEVG